jgi:TonB-linked SusC/RagA family outer membrane protein
MEFLLVRTKIWQIALFLLLLCTATDVYSQGHFVTGNITDDTGFPLTGVNIVVKGTRDGVISDVKGNYSIKTTSAKEVLVFSFIGFKTEEINIAGKTIINVVLKDETVGLNELVVTGYGTQSRRTLTTAITKVQSERIEDVPVTSVANALQGKLAGVRIFQNNGGQPGADGAIRIRGGSSINKSNSPLVIVDGMERGLSDINPADIETVQVLKDASSTAIYGSRASNGVILVTTKRGKAGKSEIVVTTNWGLATPGKYMDMTNAEEYISLVRPAVARSSPAIRAQLEQNRGYSAKNTPDSPYSTRYLLAGETIPAGYKSMQDPLDPTKILIFEDNDYQRITIRNALEQTYNISANGGVDKIKYAAGISYTENEGTAINTNYNRFTARSNVDFKVNEKITLQTRMDHSTSKSDDYNNQRNIFARSIWIAPTTKLYMEDGTYGVGQNSSFTTPLFYSEYMKRSQNTYKTGIGATIKWDITSNLKFDLKGDYFVNGSTFERFNLANYYSSTRNGAFTYSQTKRSNFDAFFTYRKTLEKHNLNAVAGSSLLFAENFNARAEAEGAMTDLIYTLNASPLKLDASTDRNDEVLVGSFARVNYDYDSKYIIGLSVRRDESSRFSPENRVGFFPGVSGGWIVSEEDFLKNNSLFSTLKLRGSIGQTGNNSVGRYAYQGTYNVSNKYYNSAVILASSMKSPDLRWETTTQYNGGADIGLFNDRVTMLFDYYTKITNDLLFDVPLPNESGYGNIEKNIGSVKFYGFEFEMAADVIKNKDFKWNVDFNIAYNLNRVLKLPDNGRDKNRIGGHLYPDGTGIGGIAVGERMDGIIGYLSDGMIDSWEEAAVALYDNSAVGWSPLDDQTIKGRKIPGDYNWKDIWQDGKIDGYDKTLLGYSTPTTTGGLGNKIKFKQFEINIFMDYALNFNIMEDVLFRSYGNLMDGQMNATRNLMTDVWKKPGDYASGVAKLPRFDITDNKQQDNYRNSDVKVMRGDYLCFREFMLAYNAQKNICKRIGINSLKLTLAIQNIYYLTAYKGYTPEFASTGGNYSDDNYPLPRKFVLGLKVGL